MKYLALAAITGLFATACATTEDGTQANSAPQVVHATATAEALERAEREGYDPYAVRCERQPVLDSHLSPRQVCRQEWQWRAMQETARDAMDDLHQRQDAHTNSTG
ncbi:MAG: hypothetical protein LAT81_06045 [Oceanicaulis sp.]|nr:hypothetical protein [Oceanicaulis sp.]